MTTKFKSFLKAKTALYHIYPQTLEQWVSHNVNLMAFVQEMNQGEPSSNYMSYNR